MADKPDTQNTPNVGVEEEVGVEQLLRLGLELGPLIVFFVANSIAGIFPATAAFMIATVLALTLSRWMFGRIPIMPLVSGIFVIGFGALTLYFQEEYFLKIKPTIVNLLFAAILFGGLLFGQSLLKYLLGEVYKLKERGWQILTFRWACFFVFLAVLNEVVWRNTSTDFWAGFKLFGIMPITMIFAISQLSLLQKYEESTRSKASADRDG